jgi:hypothetical protein
LAEREGKGFEEQENSTQGEDKEMKRYIQDDEVALILSPISFDANGWTGDLTTGLLVGEPKLMGIEDLAYLVHLATLMGAFLKMAQDDDDLYTAVEDFRNDEMGLDNQIENSYEEVEGTDGKVLRLTRFTKTLGNA